MLCDSVATAKEIMRDELVQDTPMRIIKFDFESRMEGFGRTLIIKHYSTIAPLEEVHKSISRSKIENIQRISIGKYCLVQFKSTQEAERWTQKKIFIQKKKLTLEKFKNKKNEPLFTIKLGNLHPSARESDIVEKLLPIHVEFVKKNSKSKSAILYFKTTEERDVEKQLNLTFGGNPAQWNLYKPPKLAKNEDYNPTNHNPENYYQKEGNIEHIDHEDYSDQYQLDGEDNAKENISQENMLTD